MSSRQRPGKHARSVMSDRRWPLLSLAARALWLGSTDVGDVVPAVRAPGRTGVSVEDYARYLATDTDVVRLAVGELIQCDVMEPVGSGFRLKSY